MKRDVLAFLDRNFLSLEDAEAAVAALNDGQLFPPVMPVLNRAAFTTLYPGQHPAQGWGCFTDVVQVAAFIALERVHIDTIQFADTQGRVLVYTFGEDGALQHVQLRTRDREWTAPSAEALSALILEDDSYV